MNRHEKEYKKPNAYKLDSKLYFMSLFLRNPAEILCGLMRRLRR